MQERDVIHASRDVGHQRRDILAALPILLPFPRAFHDRARRTLEQLDLAAGIEFLAVLLDQQRLVVECVALAGRAGHEKLDDALSLGRMMQAALFGLQVSESDAAEPATVSPE